MLQLEAEAERPRCELGGSCELAIGCDLIVAADNAKFGQPEIKLAVIPPQQ
jgi:enoyl-CoA hydratase/carnithine racemase